MAMRLVVATTEATDPTRNCAPFRITANVSDFSMMGVRGAVRGVTEEVRVGDRSSILTTTWNPVITWTSGPYHLEKEVKIMAKKKAAKKPAAKKAAKKTSKKK
jgi:hypothetical protein